jgi:hypothetical protein
MSFGEDLLESARQRDRDRIDAARWRWLRSKVSGGYSTPGSPASFQLPLIRPVGNIMKGSVAQHLDAAVDAARGVTEAAPLVTGAGWSWTGHDPKDDAIGVVPTQGGER